MLHRIKHADYIHFTSDNKRKLVGAITTLVYKMIIITIATKTMLQKIEERSWWMAEVLEHASS